MEFHIELKERQARTIILKPSLGGLKGKWKSLKNKSKSAVKAFKTTK